MIVSDTDVLIAAAEWHEARNRKRRGLPLDGDDPQYVPLARAAAKMFAMRKQIQLRLTDISIGQTIFGARYEYQLGETVLLLARTPILPYTTQAGIRARRLLQTLSRKINQSNFNDCAIYAIAALRGAKEVCSYDQGMIGSVNREKIRNSYKRLFGDNNPPTLKTALEYIMDNKIQMRTNPGKKHGLLTLDEASARFLRRIKARKARARRRAIQAGCVTEQEITRFYATAAFIYDLNVLKPTKAELAKT